MTRRRDEQRSEAVVTYPVMAAETGRVERCPRRVRGWLGGQPLLDSTAVLYGWEFPFYPQYHVPLGDVAAGALLDEGRMVRTPFGPARRHSLQAGTHVIPGAACVYDVNPASPVAGTVSFTWSALDAWFEEDEEVFVHPRNPYVRVDALRSRRQVRVELDGVVLAESSTPVMVFETGLPARCYLPRTDIAWEHLVPSDTFTECPYKGTTSAYWSTATVADVAWSYQFPATALSPIAGLVAFYDEKVDTYVDEVLQARPETRHA